jgi:hypothetical protein
MPYRIDLNGEPQIVAGNSTNEGSAKLQPVITPKVPDMTFAQAVRNVMDKMTDAAVVVVDPVTRRVVGVSTANGRNALRAAALADVEADEYVTLTPDNGQTGRSLAYTSAGGGALPVALTDKVSGLVEAVKPKRTVESLASSLLAGTYENVADIPLLVIDQENGNLKVVRRTEENETQVAGIVPQGDLVSLEIEGELQDVNAPADGPAPLIFEGAATPE